MKYYTTDLIRTLAKKNHRSQAYYRQVLVDIQNEIAHELKEGHSLQLTGFGTFYTRQQPEATIKSIRTGKTVRIPAHRVAAFRVGELLKPHRKATFHVRDLLKPRSR